MELRVEEIGDNPTRDVNAFLGGDFWTICLFVHGISTCFLLNFDVEEISDNPTRDVRFPWKGF